MSRKKKKEVVSAELMPASGSIGIVASTGTIIDEIRERDLDPHEKLRALFRTWRSKQMSATIETYQRDLVDFARFFGVPESTDAKGHVRMDVMSEQVAIHFLALPYEEATAVFLEYRTRMIDKKLAGATINRRMAAISSLVRSARLGWRLPTDIRMKVRLTRNVSGPGTEVYNRIIASIEASEAGGIWITRARALRDIAMIRLLHDLGLRRIEVLRLDLEDVKFGQHKITVLGKGDEGKVDVPLVNARTVLALGRWVKCRGVGRCGVEDDSNPLFLSFSNRRKGERLSLRSLNWIVRERAIEAGFVREGCKKREQGKWCTCCGKLPPDEPGGKPRSISPHGFRHTSITTLMDASGKDLARVQAFSRHKTLSMLGRYDDAKYTRAGDAQAMLAKASEPHAKKASKKKTKGRKR